MATTKPNILVLWGDDIGWWNISYNNRGQMGYRMPNIDRVGNEGVAFTDYYGDRAAPQDAPRSLPRQNPIRTGLTKVGMPGATNGLQAEDPTIAELLKPLGYATGQFGKNHFGDLESTCRRCTASTSRQPVHPRRGGTRGPGLPEGPGIQRQRFGPRGVLHSLAYGKGGQTVTLHRAADEEAHGRPSMTR